MAGNSRTLEALMTTSKPKSVSDSAEAAIPLASAPKAAVKAKAAAPAVDESPVPPAAPAASDPAVTPETDPAAVVEAVVAVGRETIDTVAKVSGDVAAKSYDAVVDLGRGHVEAAAKAHAATTQGYEAAFALGRDTLDAVIRSGNILVQGVSDFGREVATLTQETIEHNLAASQALFGARSLPDLIAVQSRLAQTSLERAIDQSSRLSDRSVQLVERSFEPIQKQVDAAIDTLILRR